MWYAILDMNNDVDSMTWLLYGTLQDIAGEVIEQCEYSNPEEDGPIDLDYLDEEDFYYEVDDYLALREAKQITPGLLKDFSFCICDANVRLSCLAEGYAAFREAFAQYNGANAWLEEICLPEHLETDEEQAFAEEFSSILFNGEYMGHDPEKEWKYIRFRDDEEKDEDV